MPSHTSTVPERIGVAVLGAGYWGINHVRVLAGVPGAALRWVGDPDPAAAARVAEVAGGVPCNVSFALRPPLCFLYFV